MSAHPGPDPAPAARASGRVLGLEAADPRAQRALGDLAADTPATARRAARGSDRLAPTPGRSRRGLAA